MALTLIVGAPGTGKTRLARLATKAARAEGRPVLVFDPYRDPAWRADYLTSDPEELLAVALAKDPAGRPTCTACLVVWDEASWKGRAYRDHVGELASQQRHHGHSVVVVCHSYTDVPPAARNAAGSLYLFQQGRKAAETAAEDRARPGLREACELRAGEALVAERALLEVRRVVVWPDLANLACQSPST